MDTTSCPECLQMSSTLSEAAPAQAALEDAEASGLLLQGASAGQQPGEQHSYARGEGSEASGGHEPGNVLAHRLPEHDRPWSRPSAFISPSAGHPQGPFCVLQAVSPHERDATSSGPGLLPHLRSSPSDGGREGGRQAPKRWSSWLTCHQRLRACPAPPMPFLPPGRSGARPLL